MGEEEGKDEKPQTLREQRGTYTGTAENILKLG